VPPIYGLVLLRRVTRNRKTQLVGMYLMDHAKIMITIK
jgi:hypothetical protein